MDPLKGPGLSEGPIRPLPLKATPLTQHMPSGKVESRKRQGYSCYAVRRGRAPGIYSEWEEARQQVEGFSASEYKGFRTEEAAVQYMLDHTVIIAVDAISQEIRSQNPALSKLC